MTDKMKRSIFRIGALLLSAMIICISGTSLPARASQGTAATPSSVPGFGYVSGPGERGTVAGPRTDNLDLEPKFSGGELRVLADETTDRQQLSMIFKSSDGAILVVDGGVAADSEHLISEIKELGGYVDAWLITHPQDDHVGALHDILQNHAGEIDIRNIYYHFQDSSWYAAVGEIESSMAGDMRHVFSSLPSWKLHGDIKTGDVVQLSQSLSFRVLNEPMNVPDEYAVNNSGIMYDITMDGKHVIVLGDMGPSAGDLLLSWGVFDGLTADLLQMSHHGQNGVTREVYERIAPKACIWPSPSWLYECQVGNREGFRTYETKAWIEEMGIKENYCIKDGDVTIR